jgi:prepilin-type N-terminal cleavage/methylation domain
MKSIKRRKAFTLIELLIVIAIIGVMASLMLPTISTAMKSVKKANSKNFMVQLAGAIDNYKAEYGYYPAFLTEKKRVNLAEGENVNYLVMSLTGKELDGSPLKSTSDRNKYNRRMKPFFDFGDHLVKKGDKYQIVDSFGNPNIYICVDAGGVIKTGYPTVSDGISKDTYEELVPQGRIRKAVIVFTLKKDSDKATGTEFYEAEDIFTW